MKLVMRIVLQTQVSSNGQMVQRQVVRQEFDLPDTETLSGAYLDVGMVNEDDFIVELIRK